MSLLNKILKSDTEKKAPKKQKKTAPEPVKEETKVAASAKNTHSIVRGVLRYPHITEKSAHAAQSNKYVFVIEPDANTHSVKKAVEAHYGVKVESVNTINLPAKERRRGRFIGWKPGVKKAIVKLQAGQTIEVQ